MTVKSAERAMGYSIHTGSSTFDAIDEDGVVIASVSNLGRDTFKILVSWVYEIHRRTAFRRQRGLCALCGRKLRGLGEADHVKSRARGQRDDRPENLKLCCESSDPGGCGLHRKKHGG